MSLLREIQAAAVEGTTDLGTLLRKCRVLAARLKHNDFRDWVNRELDGYPDSSTLPDYRTIRCHSYAQAFGPGGSHVDNVPVSMSGVPEQYRERLSIVTLHQGVSELRDMIEHNEKGAIKFAWPPEARGLVQDQFAAFMAVALVWNSVPNNVLVGILEIVRNKILNFALEIEEANPAAGEAMPGSTPVPPERMSQIFNNHFYAPVGNVASGHDINQTTTINIQKDDFDSLANFLKEQGVVKEDIVELKTAIESDPKPRSNKFGGNVSCWLGKMVGKAASGAWKVSLEVAPKLLEEALKKYGV